jgi:hypothetical protein
MEPSSPRLSSVDDKPPTLFLALKLSKSVGSRFSELKKEEAEKRARKGIASGTASEADLYG